MGLAERHQGLPKPALAGIRALRTDPLRDGVRVFKDHLNGSKLLLGSPRVARRRERLPQGEPQRYGIAEQAAWDGYKEELDLAVANEDTIAWPQTCNKIDIIVDPLWSTIPYMKGAFFYRAVEMQVGAAALDKAIATFYQENVGQAAGMQDMLDTIKAETGFDPSALAEAWLKSLGTP
jgi:hypothetical protein